MSTDWDKARLKIERPMGEIGEHEPFKRLSLGGWPDELADEPKHNCGFSGDYWQCIDGRVYGPCADENCGGVCEIERNCVCDCHQEAAGQLSMSVPVGLLPRADLKVTDIY